MKVNNNYLYLNTVRKCDMGRNVVFMDANQTIYLRRKRKQHIHKQQQQRQDQLKQRQFLAGFRFPYDND